MLYFLKSKGSLSMIISPASEKSKEAIDLFSGLQVYFVSKINALSLKFGEGKSCWSHVWECDKGKQGGGKYYESRDKQLFDQLCIQVSDINEIVRFSATVHPKNPHLPSLSLSASWGKLKAKKTSWYLSVSLDPSIMNESSFEKNIFSEAVQKSAGGFYKEGIVKGDDYFFIPEAGRHRGVFHYCLENHHAENFEEGKAFILSLFESSMDAYVSIFSTKQHLQSSYSDDKKEEQLAYHTLYLFYLLMKDGDTASALLTCTRNNISMLASLPSFVNKDILALWLEKVDAPQDILLKQIMKILPNAVPTPVDEKSKVKLVQAMVKHYNKYPHNKQSDIF